MVSSERGTVTGPANIDFASIDSRLRNFRRLATTVFAIQRQRDHTKKAIVEQFRRRLHLLCGEGGIRTPGPISETQHFQCCTIGRSVTSPRFRHIRRKFPSATWLPTESPGPGCSEQTMLRLPPLQPLGVASGPRCSLQFSQPQRVGGEVGDIEHSSSAT